VSRSKAAGAAAVAVALTGVLAGPATASPTTPAPTPAATATTPAPTPATVGGPRLAGRGVVTDLPPGVPAPPAFSAGSYLLADLDTGQVLVAKNAHGRFLPASTLKTLTVLTTLPLVDPSDVVQAVPDDLVEGTQVGLDPGSHYTVEQLLQGTMLSSGNDTATALARVAGGVEATVERMQSEAQHLGARDTTVRNPSGLDAAGQLSSAYDLALIGRAAMRLPQLRALVTTKRMRFPGKQVRGKPRGSFQIQNHNSLLYNYDGTIGVKDGYTVQARWTAISVVKRGAHTYLFTALHRGERSWRSQAAMFDWAFAYGPKAGAVGRLVEPGELDAAPAAPAATDAAAAGSDRRPIDGVRPSDRTRLVVGVGGVGAALLAVLMFALSARARRRQLALARARRAARSARR
jgi:serine-type D-Ala-D-Ala carboxypeptidase (penicillin-binding protein 5/6)